ncbi:aromatic amino acid lyase [Streptomyces sp. YKOK-I1]
MATPSDPLPVVLTGTGLTVGELIALADGEAVPAVDPEARERAVRSWRAARRLAARGRLYGRGTGVGAHRSVSVDEDDETAHGLRLLRSHAGGAGAPLPARQVRAMLAVRANQLLAGGSGIQPAIVDALTEALRLGVHPEVNEYGGIGTGDLTALAQTGLTLIGERPWTPTPHPAPPPPAPASQPATASQPGAARQPVTVPRPGLTPEPVTVPEPGFTPEPVTVPHPGLTPEPVTVPHPGLTPEPVTVPRPGLAPEPVTVPRPGLAPEPVTVPRPGLAPEPTTVPHPGLAPEPTTVPRPGLAPEPVTAPHPGLIPESVTVPEPGLAPEPVTGLEPGLASESGVVRRAVVAAAQPATVADPFSVGGPEVGAPGAVPDGDLFDSADAAWRGPGRAAGPDAGMVGWPNTSWRDLGPDPQADRTEPGVPAAAAVPTPSVAAAVASPPVTRTAPVGPLASAETPLTVAAPGAAPGALPAPVALHPGDALALLSSNALALGQAALAQHGLDMLLRATHAVAALSLAAVGGSAQAYAAAVHALRPYEGAARAAGEVRRLLGIGDDGEGMPGRRIQDPFGFRAFPQAHGCALDACARLRTVVEVEVNCPSENPLVAADGTTAHHHGGFFAAPLGLALDAADLALLQTAQLSVARLSALGDPDLTGLPAFLAAGPASSSGTMILEYTANSALADLRSCAAPASAGHAVLSRGLEEAASFAGQAARQTLRATAAYGTVLACELVTAVRALRMRPVPPPVPAFTLATAVLPVGTEDRPLTGDLAAAAELLLRLAEL